LVEPDDYNGGHAIFAPPTTLDRNIDATTISTECFVRNHCETNASS
jgi:hypothetical protein